MPVLTLSGSCAAQAVLGLRSGGQACVEIQPLTTDHD